MKKKNSLFGFWRTSSSLFPSIEKVLTGADAITSKYNRSPYKKTTAIFSLLKALIITAGDTGNDFCVAHTKDGKVIAELASTSRPEWVSIALYDPETGTVKANAMNKITHSVKSYAVSNEKGTINEDDFFVADGTVIWLAVLPKILQDVEAFEAAERFKEYYDSSHAEEHIYANQAAGLFSDNVYVRLTGGLEASSIEEDRDAHIKLYDRDQPNKLMANQLKSKQALTDVLYGAPILTQAAKGKSLKKIKPEDYDFGVTFSAEQESLIPIIPKDNIPSAATIQMLDAIKRTRETKDPVINIHLVGASGTGKSKAAKDLAGYLKWPYYTYVCSFGTTEDGLLGGIFPIPNSMKKDNTTELNNIPTSLEIEFEPEESYKKLTGETKEGVTSEEVFKLVNLKLREQIKNASSSSSGISYEYIPSPIVEAFKYGGVVEIQEPGTVGSATALSVLNDIMNGVGGILVTPYETIVRHPNCIVIGTDNPSTYIGNGESNEAVNNRWNRTFWVDQPTVDEMVERALAKGYLTDELQCRKMAEAIRAIDTCIEENSIHGVAGQRRFFDWCQDVGFGVDVQEALETCVINGITTDKETQQMLLDVIKTTTDLFN